MKVVKIKENVICMAKRLKTREIQTYVQVIKIEMKWFEDLSLKKKIRIAEAPKFL